MASSLLVENEQSGWSTWVALLTQILALLLSYVIVVTGNSRGSKRVEEGLDEQLEVSL